MQDRHQRRGLLQGFAVGRRPAGRACAGGGEGRGRGFRIAHGRHRWIGHLPGTSGDRPCRGRWHIGRVRQLHDGDAEAAGADLAHSGEHDEHRRCGAAGGERAAGRRVQIRRGVARDAQSQRHLSESAQWPGGGGHAVHRAIRLRRPGAGHGRCLHALAGKEQPDQGQNGDLGGHPAQAHAAQPARLFLRNAADPGRLLRVPHGRLSVLPVRLRHPGPGGRCHRPDHGRPRPGPEAEASLHRRLRPAAALRNRRPHRQPVQLHGRRQQFRQTHLGTIRLQSERCGRRPDL